MKPTQQQENVVTMTRANTKVKVRACAGAGKTSTLALTAESIIERSLYLAFNKVTAVDATERFPSHVTCRTTHSMAYAAFGAQLQHKLTRPKGRYVNVAGTGSEVARYYNLMGYDGVATANAMGLYVKTTVERFEQSSADAISFSHVPTKDMKKVLEVHPEAAGYVRIAAQKMWADRINVNSQVLATHDTYLKLYQLSKPVLPFKVIYVDEFQDTTPCVLDIVMNQQDTSTLVMVGDPRQAIYGWRGAINAMQSVSCPEAPLSQSFRYGQGIADVATAVLHNDMKVMGRSDIVTRIGYGVVDRTKPYMYLFRTNALLLLEAVAALDKGEKVKIEIDVKDFVKVLQSAQALYSSDMKNVKHERILPYPKWYDMVEEAGEIGGELKRLVSIVESGQAAHIISVLECYVVPVDAIATYTTAHKAKGRECEQVILADDYPTNYKKGEWVGIGEAEENLLYVALTRAMRVLEINETVQEVLELYEMEFEGESPYEETYIEPAETDREFKRLIKQEARMVDSIISGEGLPF